MRLSNGNIYDNRNCPVSFFGSLWLFTKFHDYFGFVFWGERGEGFLIILVTFATFFIAILLGIRWKFITIPYRLDFIGIWDWDDDWLQVVYLFICESYMSLSNHFSLRFAVSIENILEKLKINKNYSFFFLFDLEFFDDET